MIAQFVGFVRDEGITEAESALVAEKLAALGPVGEDA